MDKSKKFNSSCVACILKRYLGRYPESAGEEERLKYSKNVLKIIGCAGDDVSAPELVGKITAMKNDMFGYSDEYEEIKRHFNSLMLSFEDSFQALIDGAEEPMRRACVLAQLGNYIDFGAMDSVDERKIEEIPTLSQKTELPEGEFSHLLEDLRKAESLIYLTDNCGEIVMDKLLIKEIKKQFPSLSIKVFVRGEPVLNDATLLDAEQVGLCEIASVEGNGTGIAGTSLRKLPDEVRIEIENADVIIAKGQGNFETLIGCELNVYYLFLCKCKMFAEKFGVPPLTGMLINEKRI